MKPRLSIIIANVGGFPEIGWCLETLEKQVVESDVEVIVLQSADEGTGETLQQRFPWIRLNVLGGRHTIPEMYDVGLGFSRGEIVAILEDHEVAPHGWCKAALKAHEVHPNVAAIAGPIMNGCTERILDWATFISEYCRFMPPLQTGFTESIPAHNVTYKRRFLEESPREIRVCGFWDSGLHPHLLRGGQRFLMDSALTVSHQKQMGFLEYIGQRYLYSRYFAGLRAQGRSIIFRMIYGAASLILPPILLARILRCGFSKRGYRKQVLLSVPYLVCFCSVWAFGEMVGSLLGQGSSLERIK